MGTRVEGNVEKHKTVDQPREPVVRKGGKLKLNISSNWKHETLITI